MESGEKVDLPGTTKRRHIKNLLSNRSRTNALQKDDKEQSSCSMQCSLDDTSNKHAGCAVISKYSKVLCTRKNIDISTGEAFPNISRIKRILMFDKATNKIKALDANKKHKPTNLLKPHKVEGNTPHLDKTTNKHLLYGGSKNLTLRINCLPVLKKQGTFLSRAPRFTSASPKKVLIAQLIPRTSFCLGSSLRIKVPLNDKVQEIKSLKYTPKRINFLEEKIFSEKYKNHLSAAFVPSKAKTKKLDANPGPGNYSPSGGVRPANS